MLRVIAVRTGNKYGQWYEDNLKYMIDKYSGLEYDEFAVIKEDLYDDDRGVFNKLQMFDRFKDGQNIYFDLDMLIKGDCNHFIRKDFTLLHAHWRPKYHTPLNSSIISWEGDVSHINEEFHKNPDYIMTKYYKGIDQYIYENVDDYKTFTEEDNYVSFQTVVEETEACVYLFNQRYEEFINEDWYTNYQMPAQNS